MQHLWKVLPVGMLALALSLAAFATSQPATVQADVSSVTASDTSLDSGQTITVTVQAQQNDGVLALGLTSVAQGTSYIFTSSYGTGTVLSIPGDAIPGSGLLTVSLQVECTQFDELIINASQDGTSQQEQISCTPGATTTPTATPTVTGTPATATPTVTTTPSGDTLTLSAVQPNTACGQPVFLFATLKNQAGAAIAGATVTFSASGGAGSFNPVSAVTVTDGVASSTWNPPTTGTQTVTITATSGGKQATANVPVNCAAATATSTPAPSSPITPPSTGEAGIASGQSWSLYAGIAALVAVVFSGALVLARRKA